ncbi:MAG TPA: trigger factor [Candidatus Fimivivens faecavium]|nr:trigger factor [Candidatus Fimivivens faecavium]
MALVSQNKVDTNKVELVIEVKGEPFRKAVDAAYKKNAAKITLPGFRKGKAPRALIEKTYGKGMFYDDAIKALFPGLYREAVEESGIEPVDHPDAEVTEVNDEGATFKVAVTVKPEAELGKYKGIEAKREIAEVTEEEVDARVRQAQEKCARVETVTGRAAKNGDLVALDFDGFLDGVSFEGGKGEDFPLNLGSGQFIPGFEEQVVGHEIGDEFDVNVSFPENYGVETLNGKPALFKCKLKEIKEKQLPELDDEFAKDVSEFDTLEAYKADIREKLEAENREKAEVEFENKILDAVVADMKCEVPQVMIEDRAQELVRDFEYRLRAQGLNMDDFVKYTGETVEKFKASFYPQAERQVKSRIALESVAVAEKLEVSEADISAEYERLAGLYRMEADKIQNMFPKENLILNLACKKALEFLKENAVEPK